MSSLKKIDLDMSAAFLEMLDPADVFTFHTFDDNKKRKLGSLARVRHGTLKEHCAEFAKLQDQGAGIFVMINKGDGVTREGARTCRTADNVIDTRGVFLDLDGAPLKPVLAIEARATLVVESSPERWHVYWRDIACALADFRDAQLALAKKFGGDESVCDLPRVMRLPGFWHLKGEPFMTRIVDLSTLYSSK
jgi:RepB DNA-primase from phage plasmid